MEYSKQQQLKVNIVTYNVLSSHLCDPSWFPDCDPENLVPVNRLEKIKKKLLAYMKGETPYIICLQEVSEEWAGNLIMWFSKNGYATQHHLWGWWGNGNMGVMIAYPTANYELLEIGFQTIGALIPCTGKRARAKSLFRRLRERVGWVYREETHNDSVWKARERKNATVALKLKTKKQPDTSPFVVATYHMPCAFYDQVIMEEHLMFLESYLHKFSMGPLPYILVGDFNIKPQDETYQWFKERKPLSSLHDVLYGKEPAYTNFAKTKGMKEPFKAPLDYIWVNGKIDKLASSMEKVATDHATPLPDKHEPSDHLLLAGTVAFQ